MSSEAYHAETESLANTQFKIFVESPAEYHGVFVTKTVKPKKTTKQMSVGTVVHAMLLEKQDIADIARCYPSSCLNINQGLIGKNAAAFEELIKPIIALKDDEYERCIKICEAALRSPLGDVLKSNAMFETRIDAVVEGVKCRCKPDILAVIEGVPVIWDLKTTERIRPDDWWSTARQMGYGIQDAFYSLCAEAHYGTSQSTFRFWALETVGCLRVQPYWYDDRSREIARYFVRGKLKEFAVRKESKNWQDNWDSTGTIGPWDFNQGSDNELVEWEE